MHVLQFDTFGPPDVLKYVEIKTPTLQTPQDILIKVHVAGVNPVESKFRSGNMSMLIPKRPPIVLGGDYSGVVIEKGDEVKDFEIGDEVFGTLANAFSGSYAEYIVVNPSKGGGIAKKPATISHIAAGATGIAILTAYAGIVKLGKIPSGVPSKVLVIGASGGVGHYAVQIAKARGAHVVGVCSARNMQLVLTEFGADRVVDYTSQNFTEVLKEEYGQFDLVMDCVGGEDQYERGWPLLKQAGQYVTAVGPVAHAGSKPMGLGTVFSVLGTIVSRKIFGSRGYNLIASLPHEELKGELNEWLAEGKVKSWVPEGQIFPLERGSEAHVLIDTNRAVGKIVLTVA